MEIRECKMADYEEFMGLYQALNELGVKERPDCFRNFENEEFYPKPTFYQNSLKDNRIELGAFEDGKMVGMASVSLGYLIGPTIKSKEVILNALYVLPEYRCKGIATALINKAQEWGKERQAERLIVDVYSYSKDALKLGESLGMQTRSVILEKLF